METVFHGRPHALLCASTSVAARTERSCCFVLLFNYLTLFCNFLQRNVAHSISSPETQETSIPGLGQRLFEQSVHLEHLKSAFPFIPEWSPCTSPSSCLRTRTCPPGAHGKLIERAFACLLETAFVLSWGLNPSSKQAWFKWSLETWLSTQPVPGLTHCRPDLYSCFILEKTEIPRDCDLSKVTFNLKVESIPGPKSDAHSPAFLFPDTCHG